MSQINWIKTLMAVLLLFAAGTLSAATETVNKIKVQPDRAPDCTSLKSIVESITKDCKNNDEKAIATYDFLRQMNYHHAYPSEPGGISALKAINVYGWSLCGGQHTILASLWKELGWKWRYVSWNGHTTVEAFYDGDWHYLDSFLKIYVWTYKKGKRTIASEEDIKQNPKLVTDGLVFDKARRVYYEKGHPIVSNDGQVNLKAPAFLTCGDTVKGVIEGINSKRVSGSPEAWMGLKFADPKYFTDVDLGPGYILETSWNKVPKGFFWPGHASGPKHTCVDKDYRNDPKLGPLFEPYRNQPDGSLGYGKQRTWANGTLIFKPDFKNAVFLKGLKSVENAKFANGALVAADSSKPGSIIVSLSSPYVVVQGKGKAKGVKTFSISTDGGKTYKSADLANFSAAIKGKYNILAKLTFEKLTALTLQTLLELNRSSLPYLSPGANKVTVSVANPKALGKNKLVVTYAYRSGARNTDLKKLAPKGYEVGKGHRATWNKDVTYVRKTFTASQLPVTFDINISTPKGKFPVYPCMVYLRREIIAPGSAPSVEKDQLTASAEVGAKPKILVSVKGCEKLEIKEPSNVQDTIIDFRKPNRNFANVPKDNRLLKQGSKGNAFLVHFNKISNLPASAKIVKAEVSIFVWDPHNAAASQLGAFRLLKQWAEGSATWKSSGNGSWSGAEFTLGTDTAKTPESTVVVAPDQGSDVANPPIEYKFDVTGLVKDWVAKKLPNNGVAFIPIRNREIDGGSTGRFQLYSAERANGKFSPKLVIFYKK